MKKSAPVPAWRQQILASLTEKPLDLLVIGGGIVGAGVARDAAMRGLRVGLVEQRDFAFGTSSRSSRLLHGGMRYLAQGRLGLVREASVEKRVIHQIAPHLAEPLAFTFPTYQDNPAWVLWQLKLGVKIYDLLCGGRNFGKSSWLNPDRALAQVPGLNAAGLSGAVRYFDGFTNDSRLVIDTLRSARQHGALLLNYCRFITATPGRPWACEVFDSETGNKLQLGAAAVVNATGPWADGLPHSSVKLRLTKGIHVTIARSRLPLSEALVMTEKKRILFALPWCERIILGTTDTDYEGPLERVHPNSSDITYLLNVANQYFPQARLTENDILTSWAGLRPLIADSRGRPSDISRSHEIHNPEPGWWDVAGGKLTTYRLMAEQVLNEIVPWLKNGSAATEVRPCRTASEPLLPASEADGASGILPPRFDSTVVKNVCAREWAIHLEDVMLRRTNWHCYYPEAASMATKVAEWMGESLGWPASVQADEIERYFLAGNIRNPAPANSPAVQPR